MLTHTRFVNSLIYALIAGVGAYRIMSGGAFTVGQLTTFLNYVTQYTKPLMISHLFYLNFKSALAVLIAFYTILDEEEITETGKAVLEEADVQGRFQFDHVQFGYLPNKPLIKDLSIDIPAASILLPLLVQQEGEIYLINLLMRFYDLDKGTFYWTVDLLQIILVRVFGNRWDGLGNLAQVGTIHAQYCLGNPEASREEVIATAKAANADFFIQQLPQGFRHLLE